ncbi:hypothetical protein AcW1_002434 [Taiwanofungus camphoratus]|nr:hypothetical protein AcV7_005504 [Antrodia cinnamomea]KAI0926614.1 hypothetical protein AcV7_005506 [Antrodia cinnamomea]KAI0943217.1 hypothetical protein AcW1_002432 [Antrodia cinnamomea]KAI0943219.1 hypothetical protein AcW1_002434 [Antrodia cinnamomea]
MPESGLYYIQSYAHKKSYLKGADQNHAGGLVVGGLVAVVADDVSKANKFLIEYIEQRGTYHIRRASESRINVTLSPSFTSVNKEHLYLTTNSVVELEWFITYDEGRKTYMIHHAENHGHWELDAPETGTQVQVLGGHEDTLSSLVRSNKAAKFLTADQAKNIDEDAFWYLTKLD